MVETGHGGARRRASERADSAGPDDFWSTPENAVLDAAQAGPAGLTSAEAAARRVRFGPNVLAHEARASRLGLLVSQFSSPLSLLLIVSAALSFFLGEPTDASIILAIVLLSGLLGFWQENGAADAVNKLLATVQVKATLLRDGKPVDLPLDEIVPGDVIVLNAGDLIPADCRILLAKDLFVDEAALTGETFPVAKMAGTISRDAALADRTNVLYMGTHVISGTAQALAVRTGMSTQYGAIAQRLRQQAPETEFEHGLRRFGYLLVQVALLFVLANFAINVFLGRPVLDSFLFALALAIGITPQLLPAIVSINLAQGARRMAADKVIVKRLAAIENFGSMNVLCSDKTGTLTEGVAHVHAAVDAAGQPSDRTLLYANINSTFESGFTNPLDQAVRDYCAGRDLDLSRYTKLDEVPYDFLRKRLTVLVAEQGGAPLVITKGALTAVLSCCSAVETAPGHTTVLADAQPSIMQQYEELSRSGFRTLGLAYRTLPPGAEGKLSKDDEAEMTFLGLLVLEDPLKAGIVDTVGRLAAMGVTLKMITGDNRLVAATVARQVGIPDARVLSGRDLHGLSAEALVRQVSATSVFAEVEPNQKETILLALRKAGNVVGYMGDGINDASALHAADVGISVNTAVDVAKEAADIVLLEQNLAVLARGVAEGRTTFANTLKYINITTSANFGNMFSMAVVSLFLPFLPLLPKQILLNNLLTDLPAMAIADDSVDPEMVEKPQRWNVAFIRNFMIVFGLQSSFFDFLTFGTLLLVLHLSVDQFRSGWFLESAVSEVLILLVIRTRRVFVQSKPGRYLLWASLAVVVFTFLLPYTPLGALVGLVPLPAPALLAIGVILVLYVATAEVVKQLYYRFTRSEG